MLHSWRLSITTPTQTGNRYCSLFFVARYQVIAFTKTLKIHRTVYFVGVRLRAVARIKRVH